MWCIARNLFRGAIAVGIAATLCGGVSAGETIRDDVLRFTLDLPDGFQKYQVENLAQVKKLEPAVVHGFFLPNPNGTEPKVLLFIQRMRGYLPQEPLDAETVPPGFKGRLFKARWQGFDVDGFEVLEVNHGAEFLTLNAQIPLKGTAIQVSLIGPAARRDELRSHLEKILQGLHGETNWSVKGTSGKTANVEDEDVTRQRLLMVAGGVLLVGCVVFWLVFQKAQKGTVLVLAIMVWIGGSGAAAGETRMAMMISGSLKLLGTLGVILGIIDLCRTRKPKPPDEYAGT